jgi:hypothetical protein
MIHSFPKHFSRRVSLQQHWRKGDTLPCTALIDAPSLYRGYASRTLPRQSIRTASIPPCARVCRPDIWEQIVSLPYSNQNCYALNVLRSLLSRMVIKHYKEQTLNNRDRLVSLPPRHVETLLIPFGSKAERKIYEHIELGNCNVSQSCELNLLLPS